jgi:hypothetical protein
MLVRQHRSAVNPMPDRVDWLQFIALLILVVILWLGLHGYGPS